MSHSCRLCWCDTPHQDEPINLQFQRQEYIRGRETFDKGLCTHGFRRRPGSPYDCHVCVELENKRLSRPVCRGVGCDIQVPEMEPYCSVHKWVLATWLSKSREILSKVEGK